MQLSKRLQAVANLVTQGNRVADVGCDHAYTSIYLARQQMSPHIIAMDINQGPIDRARENIIKYRCEHLIETRKSNGLEQLKVNEADSIIIAGMGGALTVQILSARMEVVHTVKELILQPQSEMYKVRQMLCEQDFIIIEENMMKEDGKYYVMMKAVPSSVVTDSKKYLLTQKEHFHYGRLLLERKNAVLAQYLDWDLGVCKQIIETLTDGQTDSSLQRLEEIKERINLINKGLMYFEI